MSHLSLAGQQKQHVWKPLAESAAAAPEQTRPRLVQRRSEGEGSVCGFGCVSCGVGTPFLCGFQGKPQNHHFGGSPLKRHTHLNPGPGFESGCSKRTKPQGSKFGGFVLVFPGLTFFLLSCFLFRSNRCCWWWWWWWWW